MGVNQPRRQAHLCLLFLCLSPTLFFCTAEEPSANCHSEVSNQTTDVVGLTFGENIATEANSEIKGFSSTLEVLPTEACPMDDIGGESSINPRPPPQEIIFATKKLRSSRPKIPQKRLELQPAIDDAAADYQKTVKNEKALKALGGGLLGMGAVGLLALLSMASIMHLHT
eukprot:GHVT01043337.1.p1 GENE.GHVT01043337.1~~GHVT01043337.1.p1  ORF type:complete len:170 (+),score=17.63 GHVT01043337.1:1502-2011(+)